jgi:hypothetical protein
MRTVLLLAISVFFVVSCSEKSPKKVPVKEVEKVTTEEVAPISKDSFRPELDVLFVIDDSGSMMDHQRNLEANISKFADALVRIKYLDYHVGVISSSATVPFWGGPASSCCGQLEGSVRYVERNTPNGINVLARNMIVGTDGDGVEKFFDPVYMALTEPNLSGYNKGFYRDTANLAVIFVTDTEDQSVNFTATSFYQFLLSLKGNPDKILIAAANIGDKNVTKCLPNEASEINYYNGLDQLLQMANATTFSLCDDFGDKLADLGQKIVAKSQTMYLQQIPVPETIKVYLDGVELPSDYKYGWTYNASNNSIEFGSGIDWESYPDGVFPQVEFETFQLKPEDKIK